MIQYLIVITFLGVEVFYKALQDKECKLTLLKLDYVRLSANGIRYLGRGIAENKSLDSLSLVGCYIRPHGAQCLANALSKVIRYNVIN